jgi:hypothetical protein
MTEKRNIVTFQIDDKLAERLDNYRFEAVSIPVPMPSVDF